MTSYATLAQVKAELKAESSIDDNMVRRYITQVSKRIDSTIGRATRPFFAPYTEMRSKPVTSIRVNSWDNSFLLYDNLLSFTEVLVGTSNQTANAELWPSSPYTQLRLTSTSVSWYGLGMCDSTSGNAPVRAYITGVWGWHEDYANAYVQRDALAAGINDSVTALTVADADGLDEDGFTPRFSPGNLIRIGSELMDVVAVNASTNVLTVKRAVNGTTAAAHLMTAPVDVYLVDDRIIRITTRQAALLYARRGAFQVEQLDGVGVISYPLDLLSELRGVLTDFQYV